MTALSDVVRIAKSLSRNDPADLKILLGYYGAQPPHFVAASQAELADEMGISRQAIHARIKRMLSRVGPEHLARLTLDEATRHAVVNGQVPARRMLGCMRLENAARFYRDIAGIRPEDEEALLGRVPAAQFDALVSAAYGSRRQAEVAAARLVLVRGRRIDHVALESGLSAPKVRRAAHAIARLHEEALAAYAQTA